MKTFMVSHYMLRQSISHQKWWRVVITQRKIGKNSSALLKDELTQCSFRSFILGQNNCIMQKPTQNFSEILR